MMSNHVPLEMVPINKGRGQRYFHEIKDVFI